MESRYKIIEPDYGEITAGLNEYDAVRIAKMYRNFIN